MASTAKNQSKTTNFIPQEGTNYLHVPFNSQRLSSFPDMKSYYKSEFEERINEIKIFKSSNVASAVFTKIFIRGKKVPGDPDKDARINGEELVEIKNSSQNASLAETLAKSPLKHAARIALTTNLYKDRQELSLEQLRKLMMQLAVTIGLENYNGHTSTLLITTYRLYQKKLYKKYQQDEKELEDLVRQQKNKDGSANEKNLKNVVACKNLMLPIMQLKPEKLLINPMEIKSVSMKEIIQAIDGTYPLERGQKIEIVRDEIARSLFAMVMSLAEIEFIHNTLLQLIDVMKGFGQDCLPHALEGKLWMYRLQVAVIQLQFSKKVKPQVQAYLKKCLASYGAGLKSIPQIKHMPDVQKQIFLGYSSACLFAYSLRTILTLPHSVYLRFLEAGRGSLLKSGINVKEDPTGLFDRYLKAYEEEGRDF